MALNIMAWHKAGFTERLANTMLSGSVMLSDKSTYITEHFKCISPENVKSLDETASDLVKNIEFAVFELDKMQELPQFVKQLLADREAMKIMAENGKKRCLEEHTWDKRAEQFEEILKSL